VVGGDWVHIRAVAPIKGVGQCYGKTEKTKDTSRPMKRKIGGQTVIQDETASEKKGNVSPNRGKKVKGDADWRQRMKRESGGKRT